MTQTAGKPLSIVLRIPDVAVTRAELEEALGLLLDRFGPARNGPLSYAQINVEDDEDGWTTLVRVIERTGPVLTGLVRSGLVSRPWADIAIEMDDSLFATSVKIPSTVALTLGTLAVRHRSVGLPNGWRIIADGFMISR